MAAEQRQELAAKSPPLPTSKRETNTSRARDVRAGAASGLALLPSHVPTRQMTFSRACKAGGKCTYSLGLGGSV